MGGYRVVGVYPPSVPDRGLPAIVDHNVMTTDAPNRVHVARSHDPFGCCAGHTRICTKDPPAGSDCRRQIGKEGADCPRYGYHIVTMSPERAVVLLTQPQAERPSSIPSSDAACAAADVRRQPLKVDKVRRDGRRSPRRVWDDDSPASRYGRQRPNARSNFE